MTVLVAGIGNLFLGDDAFGVEVVRRLAERGPLRDMHGVEVRDFGIRAMDLLYALERAETALLVDAVSRGGAPGTLYVLDPLAADAPSAPLEPHRVDATSVVRSLAHAEKRPRTVRIVGCEPLDFGEDGEGRVGLSAPVEAAVDRAVAMVESLVRELGGAVADGAADA